MSRYKVPRKNINYKVSILREFNVAAAFAKIENTPPDQLISRIEELALKLNPLATRSAANIAAHKQGRILADDLLKQRSHRFTYGAIGKGKRQIESKRITPIDWAHYAVIRAQEESNV